MCNITDDRNINANVFVDRRWINIDVNLARMRSECIQTARDTVVKARSNAQHDIAIMHGHVGFVCTVHTQHTEPVLARCRISAQPHQSRGDREIADLNQFAQQLRCSRTRVDNTATRIDDRLLRSQQHFNSLRDGRLVTLNSWTIAGARRSLRWRVYAGRKLDILWNINQNRTRTTSRSNVESFVQNAREVINVTNEPVVLRARTGDTNRIRFLKAIGTDE